MRVLRSWGNVTSRKGGIDKSDCRYPYYRALDPLLRINDKGELNPCSWIEFFALIRACLTREKREEKHRKRERERERERERGACRGKTKTNSWIGSITFICVGAFCAKRAESDVRIPVVTIVCGAAVSSLFRAALAKYDLFGGRRQHRYLSALAERCLASTRCYESDDRPVNIAGR